VLTGSFGVCRNTPLMAVLSTYIRDVARQTSVLLTFADSWRLPLGTRWWHGAGSAGSGPFSARSPRSRLLSPLGQRSRRGRSAEAPRQSSRPASPTRIAWMHGPRRLGSPSPAPGTWRPSRPLREAPCQHIHVRPATRHRVCTPAQRCCIVHAAQTPVQVPDASPRGPVHPPW